MSGVDRRFDPAELRDQDGAPIDDAEAAAMLAVARDLETYAATQVGATPAGFEDRVMAAVALEAPPRPVAAGGLFAGLLLAVRDAWRITWSSDRPMAVRAQALALVLLVVVAVGSTGTLAAVGVSQWLDGDRANGPSLEPSPFGPTPTPTTEPSVSPTPSPTPSLTSSPSPTPSPEATGTEEPSETPEASDDHGGSGATQAPPPTAKPTAKPTRTPNPSDTPEPEDTPEPDDTPHPSDTPEPEDTPSPSPSPKPTSTPHSNGDG